MSDPQDGFGNVRWYLFCLLHVIQRKNHACTNVGPLCTQLSQQQLPADIQRHVNVWVMGQAKVAHMALQNRISRTATTEKQPTPPPPPPKQQPLPPPSPYQQQQANKQHIPLLPFRGAEQRFVHHDRCHFRLCRPGRRQR
jgi:hypothetical protein